MFYQKLKEYDVKFGVEIEITGISKADACALLAKTLGGKVYNAGVRYWTEDIQHRTWRIVSDSSVKKEYKLGAMNLDRDTIINSSNIDDIVKKITSNLSNSSIEIVTPPCTIQDLSLILRVAECFKQYGALTNETCGIHIHVSTSYLTVSKLRNLIKLNSILELFIYSVFNVDKKRITGYCKPMKKNFVDAIESLDCRKSCLWDIEHLWYKFCDPDEGRDRTSKYNKSRYHAFNLHSLNIHDTIEFRYFNSTLDSDKLETCILFCLAMVIHSIESKKVSLKKITRIDKFNIEYIMRKLNLNDFHNVWSCMVNKAFF